MAQAPAPEPEPLPPEPEPMPEPEAAPESEAEEAVDVGADAAEELLHGVRTLPSSLLDDVVGAEGSGDVLARGVA